MGSVSALSFVLLNGRIRANLVKVEEREELHTEGSYYIEWYQGGKRLRLSVGKNALAAEAKRYQQEQMLTAKADGLKAGLKFAKEEPGQQSLAEAVTTYLADIQLTKKPKTLSAYTVALDYFMESCKKQSVAEIDRRDMLEYRRLPTR